MELRYTPLSYQFPAILLAGMPHCGKSVLAYLLSQHLRRLDIAHYLLRAVPDGEGDWFQEGDPAVVRPLRTQNKGGYTAGFVAHMQKVIAHRQVPLLVDVGGLPQGEQFGLLRACTHAILLFKDEAGRTVWHENLQALGLPLLAELQSVQSGTGQLTQTSPYLQGTISGLERHHPQPDVTFGALLARLAGLFQYEALYLEQIHLRQAPYPPVVERQLMAELAPSRATGMPLWRVDDLPAVATLVAPQRPLALYGRGPVWLAAMLSAHTCPAPMALYDIRYGWLPVPEVCEESSSPDFTFEVEEYPDFTWVITHLPAQILEPGLLKCPPLPPRAPHKGLVVSGQLPRWAVAALVRWLAPQARWVGVGDARTNAAVIVQTELPEVRLGTIRPHNFLPKA